MPVGAMRTSLPTLASAWAVRLHPFLAGQPEMTSPCRQRYVAAGHGRTEIDRASRLAAYPAVSCAVCFAFHNGDKVRGEKVYEHSELGSEMPARRPDDSKGSGALSVVVKHGGEYAFTKLPAYGEVRQVGDAHALFGHKD